MTAPWMVTSTWPAPLPRPGAPRAPPPRSHRRWGRASSARAGSWHSTSSPWHCHRRGSASSTS
eukprot:12787614-Alexandrium_andersonii.AAC.1